MPASETAHPANLTFLLLLGFLIILANGFFVAVEFALVTSRRTRLEELAAGGSRPARLVLRMLENPDRAYAAAQLGITAASILLGIVAEEPLAELLTPLLAPTLGQWVGEAAAVVVAGLLVLLILSFFHMVVGEQAPKIVAIRNPEQMAIWLAYPTFAFARITAPFVWIVDRATALVLRLLGMRGVTAGHGVVASMEELKAILGQSEQSGLIEKQEKEMLTRVFDFGDRVVREVMVPRTNIIGVDQSQTVWMMLQAFRKNQHARFPVFDGDLDHVTGIVSTKQVLASLIEYPELQDRPITDLDFIQQPMRVPESRQVSALLVEMRESGTGLAIVIDEFGGTAGLVTLEELVEEIVGRMTDEWAADPLALRVDEHTVEIDAQMRVDEVNELFGLDLQEDDSYETVAGLFLFRLRRIPIVGQEAAVPGYKIRVLEMEGPKIVRVSISRLPAPEAVGEATQSPVT
ncbi:MAG: HlyC/CorC family transporter [Caldilineales bacterium]|nr:HlyC/CorC family transporter [Caldilineales bacterium]